MTRDSKLALVIAITMILLVGVLISDHLSGAADAAFDAPKQETPVSPLTTPSDPIAEMAREQQRLQQIQQLQIQQLQDQQLAEAARLASATDTQVGSVLSEAQPVEISQGPSEGLLDLAFERFRSAETPTLIGQRDAGDTLERSGLFDRVDSKTVTLPPASERKVVNPIKPMTEPERAAPASQPAGAAWRTHTVVEGDSMYALARVYLGDGNRWPEIQANNNELLQGSESIEIGMVLKIDRVSRASTPQGQATKTQALKSQDTKASTARSAAPAERTYVVLPGDMLGKVAQKLLGSSKRMNEIVKLNGLKDADDIKVGQTLRIPAR